MRRTLNQTGRQRILLEHANAEPRIESSSRAIIFTWDLTHYNLDQDAEVVIEVSLTGQEKRFVVGKLRDIGTSFEAQVEFLRDAKSAKAKLYVSKPSTNGVRIILATTTTFSVLFEKEPDGGNSPLQILPSDDLTTIWKLRYKDGMPILLVSNRNGVYAQLKANPIFLPSILPQVIKEIAFHLLTAPSDFESSEEVWNQFFKAYGLGDYDRENLQSAGDDMDDLEAVTNLRWEAAEAVAMEFSVREKILDDIQMNLGEEF